MAGGNSTGERLARVEEFLGVPLSTDEIPIANQVQVLREGLDEFKTTVSDLVRIMKEGYDAQIQELRDELVLVKRAAIAGSLSGREGHSKLKIPEPKSYDGARVAKDLENFLWDMEQYFRAAHIDEAEQVSITSMYLVGDAKLWWRTRTDGDASVDRPEITTFEALKKELKEQFLPLNASWLARESLRNLKQTGSVRDYVKEFSSLLLDIKNMSDEDKLFNFLAGLKPWAQAELRRQAVKDLPTAIAAADGLIDFKQAGSTHVAEKGKNGGKNHKVEDRFKKNDKKNGSGDAKDNRQSQSVGDKGCFICGGPHFAKHCPKKERLNALRVDEENEGNDEGNDGVQVRVNPMRLVTLRTEKSVEGDGLMYVKVLVNGKAVMAMVDTGATNSFIGVNCAEELGLKLESSSSQIKMANAEVQKIGGTSNVGLTVGEWKGNFMFHIVALDDFDCILGMDFFRMTGCTIMLRHGGIMIMDEACPCFVKAVPMQVDKGKKKMKKLGAVQVLVGDVVCGIKSGVGDSSLHGSKFGNFLVGPKSMSPKGGGAAGT